MCDFFKLRGVRYRETFAHGEISFPLIKGSTLEVYSPRSGRVKVTARLVTRTSFAVAAGPRPDFTLARLVTQTSFAVAAGPRPDFTRLVTASAPGHGPGRRNQRLFPP